MPVLFPGRMRRALCLWEKLNVDNIIYLFGSVLLPKPSSALSDHVSQVL